MELKTMNIKGKDYVQVNDRLKAFRSMPEFSGWSLTSDIVELKDDCCTIKATITDEKGVIRATGYAREVIAKSPVNKFAFVENCETSAWGRALGNLGIGIDSAVCSAEELLQKLSYSKEDNFGIDELKNQVKADKARATRELNKKVDEYNKSDEGLEMRYKNMYKAISGLKVIDQYGKDKELMDKITALLNELYDAKKMVAYDALNKLVNDKMLKEEPDEIPKDICGSGVKPEEYLQAG